MSQNSERERSTLVGMLLITFIIGLIVLAIGFFYDYWRWPGLIMLGGSILGMLFLIATSPPRQPS